MEAQSRKAATSIVGVSDEGYPIVQATHQCDLFLGQADALCPMHECWYCRFADFRKSCCLQIAVSICRHPANRISIAAEKKNENCGMG